MPNMDAIWQTAGGAGDEIAELRPGVDRRGDADGEPEPG